MEREINKKLRNMKKSQLEKVCDKIEMSEGNQERDGWTFVRTVKEI